MIVADSTNKENVFSLDKGRQGEGNIIITDVIYVKIITYVIYLCDSYIVQVTLGTLAAQSRIKEDVVLTM